MIFPAAIPPTRSSLAVAESAFPEAAAASVSSTLVVGKVSFDDGDGGMVARAGHVSSVADSSDESDANFLAAAARADRSLLRVLLT